MKPWVKYTLVRVGIFVIALVVLALLGVQLWIAAVIAAVVGLCVAYIFFGKLRSAMALEIANRRAARPKDADAAAEDGAAEDAAAEDAAAEHGAADTSH